MSKLFDLHGQVAVITGSTEGMGFAIARALGECGSAVVVSGRDQKRSEAAAARLAAEGIDATGLACDITNKESVRAFTRILLERCSRIDSLILNAAGPTPVGSMLRQTPDELDSIVSVNLRAALSIVNALTPQMVARKSGSVIFMSSKAAKRGTGMLGMYAMTKAAIDQYVRNLALELGPSGINVNSINPGTVRTEFSRAALWGEPEKEARAVATIPMGRLGEAEDVAGLAVLLSSAAGRFITGQNISVDGGVTA